jgi:hypothetical protein
MDGGVDTAHDATLAYRDARLRSTMNAMPPNIFLFLDTAPFTIAVLTRFTRVSLGGIAVSSSVVHGGDEWILASLQRRRLSGFRFQSLASCAAVFYLHHGPATISAFDCASWHRFGFGDRKPARTLSAI